MRTALSRMAGTTALLSGLTVALIACGDDSDTAATRTTADSAPQSNTVAPSASPIPGPSTTRAENSNAPAVPGPSLPPATSVPESKRLPDLDGTRCDAVNGPDGALTVVVFSGSSIDCGTAMPIANEYAPMIATGKPQQVQGWECGPSQTRGVLSHCVKGEDAFGFSVE